MYDTMAKCELLQIAIPGIIYGLQHHDFCFGKCCKTIAKISPAKGMYFSRQQI